MSVVTRRTAIITGLAGGLMAAGPAVAAGGPFFAREGLLLGIQLYTLSDMLAADLEGALAGLSRIGYRAVETPSYMGRTPSALRALFDRHGLACTAAHVQMRPGSAEEPGLLGDIGRLAAHMRVIGATHVYAPSMPVPEDIGVRAEPNEGYAFMARVAAAMGESRWRRLADSLSEVGRRLKAEGLAFGYHNHNFEFTLAGERTGYALLLLHTDPQAVQFELDVGWAAAAGADPAALIRAHPGRFSALHLKDVKASTTANTSLRMDPTEVGSGRLDWKAIIGAAHAAGVRQYFLEQEPPFAIPRLEAAARGYGFLSRLEI